MDLIKNVYIHYLTFVPEYTSDVMNARSVAGTQADIIWIAEGNMGPRKAPIRTRNIIMA